MTELREKMIREMELRDFAPNTIDAYLAAVKGLAGFYMRPPRTKSAGKRSRTICCISRNSRTTRRPRETR